MLKDKLKGRLLNSNAGSVLVLTIVFSLATIALGAAFLKYADHERQQVTQEIATYKAWAAAHSAMVRGMIFHANGGNEYEEPLREFYSDEDDEYVVYYKYKATSFSNDSIGFTSRTNYRIEANGYVNSQEFNDQFDFTVGHDMSSSSYADWLYITNKETQSYRPLADCTLKFWGYDTLDGKVHSNDIISFQMGNGDWPVFEKEVTTCSSKFNPPNAHLFVHFQGGYRTNFSYFSFPLQADSVRKYNWYNDPNLGVSPSAQMDSVTEIVLQPTYFLVRHRSKSDTLGYRYKQRFPIGGECGYNMTLEQAKSYSRYSYPPSKALFIEGELWLVGPKSRLHFNCGHPTETADYMVYGFGGELTIAASGDIVIAQDVVYQSSNTDGTVPVSSPDYLGLISEKHIVVWRHAPTVCKINAGMGAIGFNLMDDSFDVSRKCINSELFSVQGSLGTVSIDGINCYGWDNEKQKLLIHGCLIQKERGMVHSSYISGVRGYDSKDYIYDTRFATHPPPHFFETRDLNNFYSEFDPTDNW